MKVGREVAKGEKDQNERPIAKHHPVRRLASPQKIIMDAVTVPDLDLIEVIKSDEGFEDWALEIYEWLSLVGIESPRILAKDSIDNYLSRYQVPSTSFAQSDSGKPQSIVRVSWSGLLPASLLRNLFIELR